MNITKKIDRAFQWAGERMGAEAKTTMGDDFKLLETEMALRYDGMDRLQKSMNAYIKWMARRGETFDDKEKGLAINYLGRTMVSHGEDFEPDSQFGSCLIAMGVANECVAGLQEQYAADATAAWLESLERSLAMMKDYQAARKKLENRRLAYDASISKNQKAKREDFRIEEELRTNKAKYEETSEDVLRRMQDIKDAEVDSVVDLTAFLDAELDYHERCADELRRARRDWPAAAAPPAAEPVDRRGTGRSRPNPPRSYSDNSVASDRLSRTATAASAASSRGLYAEDDPAPEPVRMPIRSAAARASTSPDRPVYAILARTQSAAAVPARPAQQQHVPNVGALRAGLRPTPARVPSASGANVFADDGDDGASGSVGSAWSDDRCASPATSLASTTRSVNSALGMRKAPPPPPPSRAKKPPPPPPPMRREVGC